MLLRGLSAAVMSMTAALVLAAGATAAPTASGDFDGDGRDDLAVGAQGEAAGSEQSAGAVQVIYGGRDGLSSRDRIFTRATRGVRGTPGDDGFGSALAVGRFNSDRFDDLAIGAPFDDLPGITNAGSIQVLYGGSNGLTVRGDELLVHGRRGFGGPPRNFDGLGWTLAAGRLTADRPDDLAVATVGGRAGGVDGAGFVDVLRGTRRGLSTRGARRFSQASAGIAERPETSDGFGWSLATGDVARGGRVDLAIGVRRESVGPAENAGAAHVLFGSRRGVRGRGSQYLDQGVVYGGGAGIDGEPEPGDFFGAALTIARYDDRPKQDLVIGAPSEDVTEESPSPVADSGLVSFISGGRKGLRTGPNRAGGLFEPFASGGWTEGANFGYAIAAADVGKSKLEDVLIGSPNSDGTQPNSGAAAVIYGGGSDSESIQQGESGVEGSGESGDFFGVSLTGGRFDGKGPADLAIGVPSDEVIPGGGLGGPGARGSPVPIEDAGAVAVLPGTGSGVSTAGDQVLSQGEDGLAGTPEPGDAFGVALSSVGSGATFD